MSNEDNISLKMEPPAIEKHVLAEVPSILTKKEKRKIYQDNYNRINKDKQAVFKQRYKDENREKVRKKSRERYNNNVKCRKCNRKLHPQELSV